MALNTLNVKKEMINDIEMDRFGSSNDFLSTTGVGPCVAFAVLLGNGQNIFIEHRSDLFLPADKMNINNVALCLNNVGEHIRFALPGSTITGVLILGGLNQSADMINFQTHIDSLRGGVHADIHNESYYYKEFLKKILYSDVQFNLTAKEPSLTGESNIDLLVDAHLGEQNSSIIIVQHITKFDKFDITIGVLALKLKDNDNSFMIVDSKTADKTAEEIDYIVNSKGHFRSRAIKLGAVEVVEDQAIHLFNNATSLLASTTIDKKKQTRLKPSDAEIFQSLQSSNDQMPTNNNDEHHNKYLFRNDKN